MWHNNSYQTIRKHFKILKKMKLSYLKREMAVRGTAAEDTRASASISGCSSLERRTSGMSWWASSQTWRPWFGSSGELSQLLSHVGLLTLCLFSCQDRSIKGKTEMTERQHWRPGPQEAALVFLNYSLDNIQYMWLTWLLKTGGKNNNNYYLNKRGNVVLHFGKYGWIFTFLTRDRCLYGTYEGGASRMLA